MSMISELLVEASTMTLDDAKKQIEQNYKKIFPNGYFHMEDAALNSSGNDYTFHITTGMIGKDSDLISNIRHNDQALHRWMIIQENDLIQIWSAEGSVAINPEEGSYMAMGRAKTGLRKAKKLTPQKLVLRLKKDFEKIKKVIVDNKENIYGKIDKKYIP